MSNPFWYSPGEKNSPISYAMPWDWPIIGGDMLGLFGDTDPKAAPDPYAGMPGYPQYQGMNPDQLTLSPSAAGIFGNNQPMNQYSKEAMGQGPSAWARLASGQAANQALQGKEQARKTAMGEAADATANLAMKGGLGGGARENIQKQVADKGVDMAQQAQDTGARNLASIAMDDARQHTAMLGNAANMEAARGKDLVGVMGQDVDRRQLENSKQNAFNLGRYQSQMAAWGAGKQADATANSGKHGFLGMGGK